MHDEVKVDFFHKSLYDSGKRIEPSAVVYETYLNRNESVYELDDTIKKQVIEELATFQWKNYPMPYYPDIEKLIATYCGVLPEQVAVASGSASLITTLLNYFAANNRQIIIAQPSFSLYDFHCKSYNIKYSAWPLNNNLEYASDLLPEQKELSLIILASPNNPVGNVIQVAQLEQLLTENRNSLFLVDEVYNEFSSIHYTPLVEKYQNLILLRSFSKVFSSAGLRAGFMISDKSITEQVRKLILPFSLNHLSVAFLKYILSNTWIIEMQTERNKQLILERERVYKEFSIMELKNSGFHILPSQGNFLLLRFKKPDLFEKFKRAIDNRKIALLDVSKTPMLDLSIRLTIGHKHENDLVISVLNEVLLNSQR